jgi:hypothetical protein
MSPTHVNNNMRRPIPTDFSVLGHLFSQNDVVMSWWGWHPIKTASHIHIRHIQCVWAHWYAASMHMVAALLRYTHLTWLRLWWSWVTCRVKMISLCHSWVSNPIQTASPIQNNNIQSVWAHWYDVHRHVVAALLSYTHPTWLRLWWSWVTCACGVKMMPLCHGWGYLPIQTASHIHSRHIQHVWEHWYAIHIHRYIVAALFDYTHHTWLMLWWSWDTCGVKMMSLWHSWGCHIMSWLRLPSYSNSFPNP